MKTTNKLLWAAFVFALLQTISIFHLDGLVMFFMGMTILSYLKEKETKDNDR